MGGDESSPQYKKCHSFWKANGIDLKLYAFCWTLVCLTYMTKEKIFATYFSGVSRFLERIYYYPKKWAFFSSCNRSYFHVLTLENLYYRVAELFVMKNWWYMTSYNKWWGQNTPMFYHCVPFLSIFYDFPPSFSIFRGFAFQIRDYSSSD